MGNIQDALRRAEQARERLRAKPETPVTSGNPAPDAAIPPSPPPVSHEPVDSNEPDVSIAAALGKAATAHPEAPRDEHDPGNTPLSVALKRAPVAPPRESNAIRAAEAVIENYEPRTDHNLDPRLVVLHDKAGMVAEQFRRIRNNLFAQVAERSRPESQLLVLTSAVSGEGKTLTVANLGLSVAEIRGLRVLLVDGDLQRGTLSRYFNQGAAPGFTELLTNGQKPEAFVQPTPLPNLFILPSGAVGPARVTKDLLRLPAVRTTLRTLRSLYDMVLVDTPPAMKYPDAGVMAASGDGVILTVARERTRRNHVLRTVRLFHAMNIPIRGCILAGGENK